MDKDSDNSSLSAMELSQSCGNWYAIDICFGEPIQYKVVILSV